METNKVVIINATFGSGSTGKIVKSLYKTLLKNNVETYVLYTEGDKKNGGYKYCNYFYKKLQALKSRIFGNFGFNSNLATLKLIKKIKKINPAVIHIHNVHGHDINLTKFFKFLKTTKAKIVYTFHDSWAYTGYCTNYLAVNCNKWQLCCENCPLKKEFSFFFDKSKKLYSKKKEIFNGLNLTIVTPSSWLKGELEKSFLKDKKSVVINNGIDLSVFKPTDSDLIKKYSLEDKKIILGVSNKWSKNKGIDDFIYLANELDNSYKIILIGVDEQTKSVLPSNILAISKTENQKELAKFYSIAGVFVNPTYEDNYPTVNLEALASGTPVITYGVGGAGECYKGLNGDFIVSVGNRNALKESIITALSENKNSKIYLDIAKNFSEEEMCNKYLELYFN